MQAPAIPDDEARRLAALESTGALFTPAEERFDRVTRLAAKLLGTPIALVSLVADRVQWFKSAQGLDLPETPREVSFCGHAILGEETFVVEDALDDPRFDDNPLVTGEPNIRFYAGHPLRAVDGQRVGTLCVIDRRPKHLGPDEHQILRDLAAIAESELQRGQMNETHRQLMYEIDQWKRKAAIDGLTRLWNRSAIGDLAAAEIGRARRGSPLCLAIIDADHFKGINDGHGHLVGDAVLIELAARIRRALRDYDAVGRYGGEEFVAVLPKCDLDTARQVCERIRARVAEAPFDTGAGALPVTVSIGVAACEASHAGFDALVGAADQALYRAKQLGRNRVELA